MRRDEPVSGVEPPSQTRPPAASVIGARLDAGIRLELAELTPSLAATLRHAASIPNPVFDERQRMRASIWNMPGSCMASMRPSMAG